MTDVKFELEPGRRKWARIKVVGVGGAGGNAVNRMVDNGVSRVEFIAVHTDAQLLDSSRAPTRVLIGMDITHGLGADGDLEVGRRAAEGDRESLVSALTGADIVFISAGMGGGTGTGASPVVAEIARELGALTICVVTTPFAFEGKRRARRAAEGLKAMREQVDALLVLPNERLFERLPDDTNIREAFGMFDDVLRRMIRSVTDIILIPGVLNLDFADVRTVMSYGAGAAMGWGSGVGEGRGRAAAEEATQSLWLKDASLADAKGLLVSITAGQRFCHSDAELAMNTVMGATGDDADVFFGIAIDDNIPDDEIRIALIATGLGET